MQPSTLLLLKKIDEAFKGLPPATLEVFLHLQLDASGTTRYDLLTCTPLQAHIAERYGYVSKLDILDEAQRFAAEHKDYTSE